MRILMTTDCLGGVWSYATTLCRALGEWDVEVLLAVTGRALSGEQQRQAAELANVTLLHRPLKCEWMNEPWDDLAAAGEWLEGLARQFRADVVHLNDYAHGGRDFGGRPRLVVGHSCVYSWFAAVHGRAPGPEWERYRRAVSLGLGAADLVVAPTAAMLAELRRHYGWTGRDLVIPNAAPAPARAPSEDREPFILCAGRLWDEAKNPLALARAAGALPWPVKLAGEAQHPDGGAATFQNTELLGPLPHEELMRQMSRAAIYALPAKYEPFGLSALEAALRGCALVLGDIPSLREVWGEAALFVSPDDTDSIRDAIDRLIRDEPLRRTMARLARVRAQCYKPQIMATSYLQSYQHLLAQEQAAVVASTNPPAISTVSSID